MVNDIELLTSTEFPVYRMVHYKIENFLLEFKIDLMNIRNNLIIAKEQQNKKFKFQPRINKRVYRLDKFRLDLMNMIISKEQQNKKFKFQPRTNKYEYRLDEFRLDEQKYRSIKYLKHGKNKYIKAFNQKISELNKLLLQNSIKFSNEFNTLDIDSKGFIRKIRILKKTLEYLSCHLENVTNTGVFYLITQNTDFENNNNEDQNQYLNFWSFSTYVPVSKELHMQYRCEFLNEWGIQSSLFQIIKTFENYYHTPFYKFYESLNETFPELIEKKETKELESEAEFDLSDIVFNDTHAQRIRLFIDLGIPKFLQDNYPNKLKTANSLNELMAKLLNYLPKSYASYFRETYNNNSTSRYYIKESDFVKGIMNKLSKKH